MKKKFMILLSCGAFNYLVYNSGRIISQESFHYNLTTPLDQAIPFLPWMIAIYWGCFAFWILNYYIAGMYDKGEEYQFIKAHYIGEIVCFLCFIFLPTTMVRPEVSGNGFFEQIVRITFRNDAADNLLPSIHCFVSWLSWIGVRGNQKTPKWYQYFSMIMALAVCISTLTVKQHVIADVVVGVLLAEISYIIAGKIKFKKM